jgi:hypothetical protein
MSAEIIQRKEEHAEERKAFHQHGQERPCAMEKGSKGVKDGTRDAQNKFSVLARVSPETVALVMPADTRDKRGASATTTPKNTPPQEKPPVGNEGPGEEEWLDAFLLSLIFSHVGDGCTLARMRQVPFDTLTNFSHIIINLFY